MDIGTWSRCAKGSHRNLADKPCKPCEPYEMMLGYPFFQLPTKSSIVLDRSRVDLLTEVWVRFSKDLAGSGKRMPP